MFARALFIVIAVVGFSVPAAAQPKLEPGTHKDIIYARRDGLALTMDVVVPEKSNGRGIIICVSGGFQSTEQFRNMGHRFVIPTFVDSGYTVFAVMHGSQPRFTVPEIVEDIHTAVRFIKHNAKKYNVAPEKLGIAGLSSGGYLSIMMGCAWKEANPEADDPLERYSSKVAAVACFFPPTDFVQFDHDELPEEQRPFRTLFDIRRLDSKTNKLERITDAERREFGRQYSPQYCAKDKQDAAPTYLLHGTVDELVPTHQSTMLHDLMTDCGAVCKLELEKDLDHHDVFAALKFLPRVVEWFDTHL